MSNEENEKPTLLSRLRKLLQKREKEIEELKK
jgi:hypothetical protein